MIESVTVNTQPRNIEIRSWMRKRNVKETKMEFPAGFGRKFERMKGQSEKGNVENWNERTVE